MLEDHFQDFQEGSQHGQFSIAMVGVSETRSYPENFWQFQGNMIR